jgi:hypothetical protein
MAVHVCISPDVRSLAAFNSFSGTLFTMDVKVYENGSNLSLTNKLPPRRLHWVEALVILTVIASGQEFYIKWDQH